MLLHNKDKFLQIITNADFIHLHIVLYAKRKVKNLF